MLSAANVNDHKMLETVLDDWRGVRRRGPGRPRKRFHKFHADKGYDYAVSRRIVRRRGMVPRIARRGVESTKKLGRHRWAVERTMSWFDDYRKLRIRDERRAAHYLALHKVAAIDINCRELAKVT